MSVIGDTTISASSPVKLNFIAYKKTRAQAKKVIRNAKRDSFHTFTATVNCTTPLTQVWSIIHILNNKKTYNPVTSLTAIDNPPTIANAVAQHFEQASSTASHDPAFLPRKEASELTVSNSEYNTELTLDELFLALKSCKGSSPDPDNVAYNMKQHLGHTSHSKLLFLYNEI